MTLVETEQMLQEQQLVLLIDSNEDEALRNKKIVEQAGFSVHMCLPDAIHVNSHAAYAKQTLLLCSIRKSSDWSVFSALFQTLKLFLQTGSTPQSSLLFWCIVDSDDDVERAQALGCDCVMVRPIGPNELVAHIKVKAQRQQNSIKLARLDVDTQMLLELTQTLASSLELQEILYTVVSRVAEVVGVERASLVLVREQDEQAYVVATSDIASL
jgi:DNA-binding response OmpR family regulator